MVDLLLVEDDPDLALTLHQALSEAGYQVHVVGDGEAAELALANGHFALMVLDLNLPKRDGLDVLRRLRAGRNTLPVLVLTARDGIEHRVRGLKLGADDYLAKPFALQELEARLEALVRRAHGGHQALRHGPLQLLPDEQALMHDKPLELTQRELRMLEVLMLKPGQVIRKHRLGQQLGDHGSALADNAVEVHMHRLRRKLEPLGIAIRTVHGIGYVLEAWTEPRGA